MVRKDEGWEGEEEIPGGERVNDERYEGGEGTWGGRGIITKIAAFNFSMVTARTT